MKITELNKTCCFFGHRKIEETPELKACLINTIEDLITNKDVDTFLFGSKSEFDDLCHKTVTELKEKSPHSKRIYVRSAFQHIPDWAERKNKRIINILNKFHLDC